VAFDPDLSKILQLSVDEILAAGLPKNEEKVFQKLVDDNLFKKVMERFARLTKIADLDMDLDFFVYLNNNQKMELIKCILSLAGFGLVLDEILPYTALAHKTAILDHIMANREYELLEQMTMYMSNDMKAKVLAKLLAGRRFDIIEDIITTFNRKHRDLIVEFFTSNMNFNEENFEEEIENFIPFFDKNQIERLVGAAAPAAKI
jgi:hypothetical protein